MGVSESQRLYGNAQIHGLHVSFLRSPKAGFNPSVEAKGRGRGGFWKFLEMFGFKGLRGFRAVLGFWGFRASCFAATDGRTSRGCGVFGVSGFRIESVESSGLRGWG